MAQKVDGRGCAIEYTISRRFTETSEAMVVTKVHRLFVYMLWCTGLKAIWLA
jgi:hypothetical protein